MDPWGNAAAQYNQGLGQLQQINQQGYQAQAQGPASIYDRFLQGYVQAKQMKMQEEAAARDQQNRDRQTLLAEETLRHNRSVEAQRMKDEQDKMLRDARAGVMKKYEGFNDRIPGSKELLQADLKSVGLSDIPLPSVSGVDTNIELPGPVPPGQRLMLQKEDRLSGLGPSAYDSEQKQMESERMHQEAEKIRKDDLKRKADEDALRDKRFMEGQDRTDARLDRRLAAESERLDRRLSKQPEPKIIPQSAQKGIIENTQALASIDRALDLLKKNKSALGVKNYLSDGIVQRYDPEGVEARAAVTEVANKRLHDLSGAAVTLSEDVRFRPNLPQRTDDPDVAIKKLEKLKETYTGVLGQMGEMYSEANGFRPNSTLVGSPAPKSPAPSGDPSGMKEGQISASGKYVWKGGKWVAR